MLHDGAANGYAVAVGTEDKDSVGIDHVRGKVQRGWLPATDQVLEVVGSSTIAINGQSPGKGNVKVNGIVKEGKLDVINGAGDDAGICKLILAEKIFFKAGEASGGANRAAPIESVIPCQIRSRERPGTLRQHGAIGDGVAASVLNHGLGRRD